MTKTELIIMMEIWITDSVSVTIRLVITTIRADGDTGTTGTKLITCRTTETKLMITTEPLISDADEVTIRLVITIIRAGMDGDKGTVKMRRVITISRADAGGDHGTDTDTIVTTLKGRTTLMVTMRTKLVGVDTGITTGTVKIVVAT